MSKTARQIRFWLIFAIAASSLQACGIIRVAKVAPTPTSVNALLAATASPIAPEVAQSPAATLVIATATQWPTQAPVPVTVAAARGNVFVRRGPDLAFNPISVLRQGQIARATGRDVLSRWLRIDLPTDPGSAGWISVVTAFTDVTGDVRSLPELEPTYWPVPAFLRNCTHDEMIADPGGILIPPVDSFPENDLRLNPGTYVIRDLDVDNYPEVLTVDLREGSAIDIRVNGYGEKKKCPLP